MVLYKNVKALINQDLKEGSTKQVLTHFKGLQDSRWFKQFISRASLVEKKGFEFI